MSLRSTSALLAFRSWLSVISRDALDREVSLDQFKAMKGFTEKVLIFVAVMALVAGAGWFGRKAYKKTMERRLVSEAKRYLATNDLRSASLSLRRALEINPVSANASDAMADVLEAAGAPGALNWRIRAAKLDPKDSLKRFRWAETAIKANDLASANEALGALDEKSRSTSNYHKLKGALAWTAQRFNEAETEYLEANRLEPGNLTIQLNLATIRLTSTNQAVAQAARISLEQIATNATYHLTVLHQLLTDAVAHKQLSQAVAYSSQITKEPGATVNDAIQRLELLRLSKSSEYAGWLALVEQRSTVSAEQAFALGRWKAITGGPTNALLWITSLPIKIQTNLPVPLVTADCQIALKDWTGILNEVDKQNWGVEDYYRMALQSLAQRSLSQSAAAEVSWHKAVRMSSHRLDQLSHLAEVSGMWQWPAERVEVLTEITDEFPKENRAVGQLADELYAEGKTREMEDLFSKVYSKDPSNIQAKNNLANLYLLQKTELNKAFVMAKEAYSSSTNNPFFASTYAYSLLLQDKKDEALSVVNGFKAEYLKIPSIALYYGVVQAQSGHKEVAREALKCAESSKLLPEERAIVQFAEARM
jgi:predicted Zn-dependent protease